jgi:hypothetical protein
VVKLGDVVIVLDGSLDVVAALSSAYDTVLFENRGMKLALRAGTRYVVPLAESGVEEDELPTEDGKFETESILQQVSASDSRHT